MRPSAPSLALWAALVTTPVATAAQEAIPDTGTAPPVVAPMDAPLPGDVIPDGGPAMAEPPAEDAAPNPAAAPEGGMMEGLSALPDLDLGQMNATRDRPLFSPERRPTHVPEPEVAIEAPPPVADVAPPMPFDYLLLGVIYGDPDSIVVLSQPGAPVPVRAKIGDSLNGWTVTTIGQRSVVMRDPAGEERTLTIFDNSNAWSTDAEGRRTLRLGTGGAGGSSDGEMEYRSDGDVVPETVPGGEPPQGEHGPDGAAPPQGAPGPDDGEPPKRVRQVY